MNSTALAFDVLAEYHLEGEVTEGKLFGYSCLEVDCKAFLVDFEDDLVFNPWRSSESANHEAFASRPRLKTRSSSKSTRNALPTTFRQR